MKKNIVKFNEKTVGDKYYGYRINNKKNAERLKPTKNIDVKNLGYYELIRGLEEENKEIIPEYQDARNKIDFEIGENELLRNNNGFVYSILKPKGHTGYVFYTLKDGKVVDEAHIIKLPSKNKMIRILKKGLKRQNLLNIDPTVLESESNVSVHRFIDGTMLLIFYEEDANWKNPRVSSWIWEKDPVNLVNNILKKDYDLIK